MNAAFRRFSAAAAHASGSPWALIVCLLGVAIWLGLGPSFGWSDSFQLVGNDLMSVTALLMAFVIQASVNRDGAILQAKLDRMMVAIEEVPEDLVGIQNKPEEDFE